MRMFCVVAVSAGLLGGCATPIPPGTNPTTPSQTAGPEDELTGQGMVLQKGNASPVFCLGPVQATYPPQTCAGPVIRNWNWSEVTGHQTVAGITWGVYKVSGTWDNGEFVRHGDPVPSSPTETAIPGPAAPVTGKPGKGTTSQLTRLQQELKTAGGRPILMSWVEHGYLVILVAYDNGDVQRDMDRKHGADMILVRSALTRTL